MIDLIHSRIAPTPSGYLHLGNAFNFLLTEKITRGKGGNLRLRIDDLDAPRLRREYLEDIFETLKWLGIGIDAGPHNVAEQMEGYSQQLRIGQYNQLLERLVGTGKVFACECSRKEVQERSVDGQYPGTCRDKKLPLSTEGLAWRYRTDGDDIVTWTDAIMGPQTISISDYARDFIIRRRDGLPAYHVASLSDDVAYRIDTIVRGEDLLFSTAAQLWLAKSAGLDAFSNCAFYHHPLLVDETGEKLSKSAGSMSLKAMRAAGVAGSDIREWVATWYGGFL
jgi:glutamyl/glutaminyl-tRNA synthetase